MPKQTIDKLPDIRYNSIGYVKWCVETVLAVRRGWD